MFPVDKKIDKTIPRHLDLGQMQSGPIDFGYNFLGDHHRAFVQLLGQTHGHIDGIIAKHRVFRNLKKYFNGFPKLIIRNDLGNPVLYVFKYFVNQNCSPLSFFMVYYIIFLAV